MTNKRSDTHKHQKTGNIAFDLLSDTGQSTTAATVLTDDTCPQFLKGKKVGGQKLEECKKSREIERQNGISGMKQNIVKQNVINGKEQSRMYRSRMKQNRVD